MSNNFIKLASIAFILVSCGSSKHGIITNKEEAQSKGVYTKLDVKKLIKEQEARVEKLALENKYKGEIQEADYVMSEEYVAEMIDESSLENTDDTALPENSLAHDIVAVALDYRGTPYRYGGMTRKGIDCSALIYNSFGAFDLSIPRTSYEQSKQGKKIKRKNAAVGDLIFFRTGRRKVINHVGLITENVNGEIKFVHASSSKGVMVSSLNQNYYSKAFVQINRLLQKE